MAVSHQRRAPARESIGGKPAVTPQASDDGLAGNGGAVFYVRARERDIEHAMSITIIRADPETGLQLVSDWRAGTAAPRFSFRCDPPRPLPAHLIPTNDETLAASSAAFDLICRFLRNNPE